jgi:lysophospholipase L1-like esterase
LGLYGEEVPQRKPAGQFRILVVGDSSAFGWGVELEQRFSNLLEARLRARHPDWDVCVLNAAVPAYSSLTCARLFDLRLARVEPDMVIVSVNNDPAFEARSESQQLPWDANVVPRAALYRSTLYMCLRKVILNSRTRSHEPSPPAGEVPRVSDQEIRQSYIRLLSATRGPSVVLSMPKRDHPVSPRIEHVRKLTEEVARREKAIFVDSYSSFLAAGRVGEAWFSDWVHPRPEGHRLIAEELLPEVERVVAASRIPGMRP